MDLAKAKPRRDSERGFRFFPNIQSNLFAGLADHREAGHLQVGVFLSASLFLFVGFDLCLFRF